MNEDYTKFELSGCEVFTVQKWENTQKKLSKIIK